MDINKLLKELSDYLAKVKDGEAGRKLGYVLKRLEDAKDCIKRGKDPAGMKCDNEIVGEHILKTWRISGEKDILSSLNGGSPPQLYINIRKHILESSKKFIGMRFDRLYEIEKSSYSIYTYLLKGHAILLQASRTEPDTEFGGNLEAVSKVFKTLAYKIYNAFDLDGRFISYREVIEDSREIYDWLSQAGWDGEPLDDVPEEINDVSKICKKFRKILSIYIDQDSPGREKSGYASSGDMGGDSGSAATKTPRKSYRRIVDMVNTRLRSREIRHISMGELVSNKRGVSDGKSGAGEYSKPTATEIKRRKALETFGESLEKMISQKGEAAINGATPDAWESRETTGTGSAEKPGRKDMSLDKILEKEVVSPRAGVVSPRSGEDEMVESLRMLFYLEPMRDREPPPKNRHEEMKKKRLDEWKAMQMKYTRIGIMIVAVLLLLSYVVYRKKWIMNYFAGRNTENLIIETSGVPEEKLHGAIPVVLVGRIDLGDGVSPTLRKDGKHFFQGLRVTCYFPDIHHQREFYDYNFQVSNNGDFRIRFKVPPYKKKTPATVKITYCCCGYRDCETKFMKFKGEPLTAYFPDIIMEREE
ncbi:MAG: hypothetical protein K8T10_05605 [Candidatus Eremiobacteraeota bacterium]|nr:hypothetical protein [Candidatus Eremiobacteraeota bacterium]